jgi:hypothetical protein
LSPDTEIFLRLELITFINFALERFFAEGFIGITVNDKYPDSVIRDVLTGFRNKGWKVKKEKGEKKYFFSK